MMMTREIQCIAFCLVKQWNMKQLFVAIDDRVKLHILAALSFNS